ncbi:MAG: hypothetical protein M1816_002674 [Peltula sp. TS41687]|nr:MAG: hypothetical protein M1816_002674 [Peltula sp. TS41687]
MPIKVGWQTRTEDFKKQLGISDTTYRSMRTWANNVAKDILGDDKTYMEHDEDARRPARAALWKNIMPMLEDRLDQSELEDLRTSDSIVDYLLQLALKGTGTKAKAKVKDRDVVYDPVRDVS